MTQLERLGSIDRTPGIPGSDKNAERMDKCYIAICADYDDHGKWVELVSR